MKPVQACMLVFKLVVTGALLWLLFRKVDLGPVAMRIGSMNAVWAAIAINILFAQLLLTGVRWYFVEQMLGACIQFSFSIRLILIGQFFNQVLPSSVGGDGIRAWLLSRENISIRRALVSVLCDRAAALVVLTVVVACTLPFLIVSGNATIPSVKPIAIAVAVLTMCGLLFLFIWGEAFSAWLFRLPLGRPFGVVIRDLRRVLFSSVESVWVVGLSVLVQVLLVMSIYFFALALRVEFSMMHLLMLPLIMLLSSIPVSFAGWGLRESLMVAGLGFAGTSVDDALAVSVSFGIAQMLIGLPGFLIAVISIYKYNVSKDRSVIQR